MTEHLVDTAVAISPDAAPTNHRSWTTIGLAAAELVTVLVYAGNGCDNKDVQCPAGQVPDGKGGCTEQAFGPVLPPSPVYEAVMAGPSSFRSALRTPPNSPGTSARW